MTSKKELKKERKRLLQANKDLAKENYKLAGDNETLNQENQAILDGWSTYQSTHPDLTGIATVLEKLVAVEAKRNQMIQDNNDRAAQNMEEWERSLKENEVKVDDFLDIQREAVERDYLDSEAQFEQNLALMLHRAEDEGDNHCVIMGSESDGNIKAWIRVMFTGPPENVGDKVRVFNYRGQNYLQYDLWNETKLRDLKVKEYEHALEWLQDLVVPGMSKQLSMVELVRGYGQQMRAKALDEMRMPAEFVEGNEFVISEDRKVVAYQGVNYYSDEHAYVTIPESVLEHNRQADEYNARMADTAVAERANGEPPSYAEAAAEMESYRTSNMRDPRYRAAVEAMDDVQAQARLDRNPEAKKRITEALSSTEGDRAAPWPETAPLCSHPILYREKNQDKCTECDAVIWPRANYNSEGKRMVKDNPQA